MFDSFDLFNEFPPELRHEIVLIGVRATEERFERAATKGHIAGVCREWKDVLYDAGDLWNEVFIHSSMSIDHVRLLVRCANKTSRDVHVEISTHDIEKNGGGGVLGLIDKREVKSWSQKMGAHLASIVSKAKSITLRTLNQRTLRHLLRHTNAQHARSLSCVSFDVLDKLDNRNGYLGAITSASLDAVSLSRVSPLNLAAPQLHGIRQLRLSYLINIVSWDQFFDFLASCVALEHLRLSNIACYGSLPADAITIASLHELDIDLSRYESVEVASRLLLPALTSITLRGQERAPWAEFTAIFEDVMHRVQECIVDADVYSAELASLLSQCSCAVTITPAAYEVE
ncbi:hypothetical protein R3P38DRAFT_3229683 [Favolaschia claudopus]|uniref:F-box domain-containing protein n=1 Tax=Favolaschia claudopus TaxID=2862362 RepID=A0AAV9ZNI9_9AGAR